MRGSEDLQTESDKSNHTYLFQMQCVCVRCGVLYACAPKQKSIKLYIAGKE
ncbi:hypothetical protein C5S39_12160 [Candidatus Methanophagaceae archaeon]|nr:hypothetical protein C5S39_12160 [Methanophagales archaeon]